MLTTPTRSTGFLPAYDGMAPNVLTSSQAGNAANINRGFKQDQTSLSGDVDIWLGRSNYITVRGGYFYDNYADTGIPTTTSVRWNTTSVGVPGVPAALQQPIGFQNTPRAIITNFDTTKLGIFQIDYNHSFSAAGLHVLKGGFGIRNSVNDVDSSYPGGYVLLAQSELPLLHDPNSATGREELLIDGPEFATVQFARFRLRRRRVAAAQPDRVGSRSMPRMWKVGHESKTRSWP